MMHTNRLFAVAIIALAIVCHVASFSVHECGARSAVNKRGLSRLFSMSTDNKKSSRENLDIALLIKRSMQGTIASIVASLALSGNELSSTIANAAEDLQSINSLEIADSTDADHEFNWLSDPIYKFRFKVPEGNKMLTTTIRSEVQPGARAVPRNKFFWQNVDGIKALPTTVNADNGNDDFTQIRTFLRGLLDTGSYKAEVVGSVLAFLWVIDTMQTNSATGDSAPNGGSKNRSYYSKTPMRVLDRTGRKIPNDSNNDGVEHSDEDRAKALEVSNAKYAALIVTLKNEIANLQIEAKAMRSQVETAQSSSSASVDSSKSSEAVAKIAMESKAKISALEVQKRQLSNELVATKKQLEAKSSSSSSSSSSSPISSSSEVLSSLQTFLVDQGYLSNGLANMLLASTLPKTLKELNVPTTVKTKASQKKSDEAEKRVAELEKELSKASDMKKYMKELTTENEELKQKLLASEAKMWDLQENMQSKLDSAKAVAKQLNTKLMDQSMQETEKKAEEKAPAKKAESAKVEKKTVIKKVTEPAKVEKKVTEPAKVEKKVTEPVDKKGQLRAEVKKLSESQLKKMVKKDLESLVVALGEAKAAEAADLTKAQLLEIILKV